MSCNGPSRSDGAASSCLFNQLLPPIAPPSVPVSKDNTVNHAVAAATAALKQIPVVINSPDVTFRPRPVTPVEVTREYVEHPTFKEAAAKYDSDPETRQMVRNSSFNELQKVYAQWLESAAANPQPRVNTPSPVQSYSPTPPPIDMGAAIRKAASEWESEVMVGWHSVCAPVHPIPAHPTKNGLHPSSAAASSPKAQLASGANGKHISLAASSPKSKPLNASGSNGIHHASTASATIPPKDKPTNATGSNGTHPPVTASDK